MFTKQWQKISLLLAPKAGGAGTKILEGMLILVPWVGPKFYESILVYEY